jgi:hypothetical protein
MGWGGARTVRSQSGGEGARSAAAHGQTGGVMRRHGPRKFLGRTSCFTHVLGDTCLGDDARTAAAVLPSSRSGRNPPTSHRPSDVALAARSSPGAADCHSPGNTAAKPAPVSRFPDEAGVGAFAAQPLRILARDSHPSQMRACASTSNNGGGTTPATTVTAPAPIQQGTA